MNKKTKIALSILGLVFGVSAVLSGCAPKVTKISSSALPPARKPVVAVQPTPSVTVNKKVPGYLRRYPWLASYNIQANSNNIHFAFDKSILTPLDKMILRKDAIYLKYHANVAIQIQGNCDRRGSEAYNLALGWRRANAAKAYLGDLGISANRLGTISFGKERPLCNAHTGVCYAMNRRDHLAVASR
jgi:peptidoglycan-associated lipoprotein